MGSRPCIDTDMPADGENESDTMVPLGRSRWEDKYPKNLSTSKANLSFFLWAEVFLDTLFYGG